MAAVTIAAVMICLTMLILRRLSFLLRGFASASRLRVNRLLFSSLLFSSRPSLCCRDGRLLFIGPRPVPASGDNGGARYRTQRQAKETATL
jgi:hypothetical protein